MIVNRDLMQRAKNLRQDAKSYRDTLAAMRKANTAGLIFGACLYLSGLIIFICAIKGG